MAKGRRRKNNKGMTLIELMVSFTLLSVFMAVGMAVVLPYYQVRGRMETLSHVQAAASVIQDAVKSEASSAVEYIKLRDEDGIALSLESAQSGVTGAQLEFIGRQGYVEAMHALGGAGYIMQGKDLIGNWEIPTGYLACLTYVPDPNEGYHTQADGSDVNVKADSDVEPGDIYGTLQVARAATMNPEAALYMGYTAEVTFDIPPEAFVSVQSEEGEEPGEESGEEEEGASSAKWQVRYLHVTIQLKDEEEKVVYEESNYVEFLNQVVYEQEPTADWEKEN